MTKKELSQLRYLNKEIELLQKQIENAEYNVKTHKAFDFVEGSNPKWPYQHKTFYIEGVAVPEYEKKVVHIRKKLIKRLSELMDQVEKINNYIESVDDCEVRNILRLRYVDCLTWEEIGREMMMDERTARRKHKKWWDEN